MGPGAGRNLLSKAAGVLGSLVPKIEAGADLLLGLDEPGGGSPVVVRLHCSLESGPEPMAV